MVAIALGSCSTPDVPNPKDIIVDSQPEQPNPDSEPSEGKTLVIYYSYTGNTREIVADLQKQINCDVVEIIPEGTFDYNAKRIFVK